jgi:hypothetical protein
MVAFIDQHRDLYRVEPICDLLPIAPSTYFRHRVERFANPTVSSVASDASRCSYMGRFLRIARHSLSSVRFWLSVAADSLSTQESLPSVACGRTSRPHTRG